MQRTKAWLQLFNTPEIGYAKSLKIIKQLGDPVNYLGKKSPEIDSLDFINPGTKKVLQSQQDFPEWDRISLFLEKQQIRFITYLDEDYPFCLKNIYGPPLFLFVKGDFKKEDFRRSIAVVGTRKPTNYGRMMTDKITEVLVQNGFTIVSGLAEGIDTQAHKSCLKNNGRTVAVLGTGQDVIFPSFNKTLSDNILLNGCLISEYLPFAKIDKWNFVNRNRIISGLSLGTIVVEGKKQSGAMITAKFALEQNREIFALPGNANQETSEGPNFLIKQGANIISKPQDILEVFNLSSGNSEQTTLFPDLESQEEKIYQLIAETKPDIDFDSILTKSDMNIGELSSILLMLELKNVIKRIAGNKFIAMY